MDPNTPLVPPLAGLKLADLQAAYLAETGSPAPGDQSADALRTALQSFRDAAAAAPIVPAVPVLVPSRAADTISVIDNENQLEQDIPQAVWKELGEVAQAGYTIKADKPAELR